MRCCTQQSDNGIDEGKNQRIGGGLGQSQVKIEVGLDVDLGIFLRAIHHSDGFAHRREILIPVTRSAAMRGDSRFEDEAQLHQMRQAFLLALLADLHHEVERLPRRLRGSVGDEGAAAGVGFNQTFLAQRLDRFAHGSAAHAETLREIALGGKLVARLQ